MMHYTLATYIRKTEWRKTKTLHAAHIRSRVRRESVQIFHLKEFFCFTFFFYYLSRVEFNFSSRKSSLAPGKYNSIHNIDHYHVNGYFFFFPSSLLKRLHTHTHTHIHVQYDCVSCIYIYI